MNSCLAFISKSGALFWLCYSARICYEASRQTAVRARWETVMPPSMWSGHRLPFENCSFFKNECGWFGIHVSFASLQSHYSAASVLVPWL